MTETWKQPFQLGVKAFRESKHEEAIKHFTRSIDLDSHNATVFDSRAAAYQCVSKLREALADTRKCISLQPERYVGYYRSARVFLAMHKYDRCIQMIGEARRRMNVSDASYSRKTQELDEMEAAARKGLHAVETYHRNHVDLLKKLPLELLVDICKIAVDTSDDEAGPRGASYFALTLGSVCRSLRDLVHRTPSFWQCVSFSEKRFSRKSTFWLERLGGYPLYSVALIGIGQSAVPQVLETLNRTKPESWRCLRIEGDDRGAFRLYEALRDLNLSLGSFAVVVPLEASASGLNSMSTYRLDNSLKVLAPSPETQGIGAPARKLALRVGKLWTYFSGLSNVTHLDLDVIQLSSSQRASLEEIIHTAPNLLSLSIKAHPLYYSWPAPSLEPASQLEIPSSLRLGRLEVLRLVEIGPSPNHSLAFPNLQVLDLQFQRVPLIRRMVGFLLEGESLQPCPPIRELRLNRVILDEHIFKLAMDAWGPTLESLEISQCGILNDDTAEWFSRPAPGAGNSVCCPRLRDINFSGNSDLKAGPLVRLIKARLPSSNVDNPNPPTPIRNLIIDNCEGIDSEALPWMRANVTGVLSCVYKTKVEAKGRRRDRFL